MAPVKLFMSDATEAEASSNLWWQHEIQSNTKYSFQMPSRHLIRAFIQSFCWRITTNFLARYLKWIRTGAGNQMSVKIHLFLNRNEIKNQITSRQSKQLQIVAWIENRWIWIKMVCRLCKQLFFRRKILFIDNWTLIATWNCFKVIYKTSVWFWLETYKCSYLILSVHWNRSSRGRNVNGTSPLNIFKYIFCWIHLLIDSFSDTLLPWIHFYILLQTNNNQTNRLISVHLT